MNWCLRKMMSKKIWFKSGKLWIKVSKSKIWWSSAKFQHSCLKIKCLDLRIILYPNLERMRISKNSQKSSIKRSAMSLWLIHLRKLPSTKCTTTMWRGSWFKRKGRKGMSTYSIWNTVSSRLSWRTSLPGWISSIRSSTLTKIRRRVGLSSKSICKSKNRSNSRINWRGKTIIVNE